MDIENQQRQTDQMQANQQMQTANSVALQEEARPMLQSGFTYIRQTFVWYKVYSEKILIIMLLPCLVAIVGLIIGENVPMMVTRVYLILTVVIGLICNLALIHLVSASEQIQHTIRDYFSASIKMFFPFLWVYTLMGASILGGFMLLVIPALYLSVAVSFAFFVLITENKRGFIALEQSLNYVRGYWWSICGKFFLFFLLLAVSAIVFLLALGAIFLVTATGWYEAIANVVVVFITNFLLIPFNIIFSYLLFESIRTIRHSSPNYQDTTKSGWKLKTTVVLGFIVLIVLSLILVMEAITGTTGSKETMLNGIPTIPLTASVINALENNI